LPEIPIKNALNNLSQNAHKIVGSEASETLKRILKITL